MNSKNVTPKVNAETYYNHHELFKLDGLVVFKQFEKFMEEALKGK